MNRIENGHVAFLIASPERALADKVREDRSVSIRSLANAENYLFDDLRLEVAAFLKMDYQALLMITQAIGSHKALHCAKLLRKMLKNLEP